MANEALPFLLNDIQNSNPLIRALSLRTISTVHVKEYVESLVIPLRKLLHDEDPYVRKTAAIAVAKLHGHDKVGIEKTKLIDELKVLLVDPNTTVVANALVSLMDICKRSSTIKMSLNMSIASKLVAALDNGSEWSQVYILESLMLLDNVESVDAVILAERISPRLQHANSSVTLTTTRVLLHLIKYMENRSDVLVVLRKLTPPLVTLISAVPELQFVALRNVMLIMDQHPEVLKDEIRVFFCKYNDPIYVKLSKLEIMIKLANESNVYKVLEELKEYATEIDIEFVRKAVNATGKLAIQIEIAADQCVATLMDLVTTKVSYVVQEATVVIKDIFRRYPGRYEHNISTLCENLDSLDEPEAKTAMVWIVGQYADRIENADELLDDFYYSFEEEALSVQLALLTASVKLFLVRPSKGQDLVLKLLTYATKEAENPDLRDRGYIYWRLLSTNLEEAKRIVLSDMEIDVHDFTDGFKNRENGGDALLENLGTLSSVFHKIL